MHSVSKTYRRRLFLKREVSFIQIINNIEDQANAHWFVKKIASSFCKHCEELNERNIREASTNLTATQSFKSQNYCDNESISTILEALKCTHFDLQFWLDKWKSYVIVDWCARCETIVQTHCTNVTNTFCKSNRHFSNRNILHIS